MQQRTGALLVLASAVAFGVMPIFGKLAFEAGVGVATLLVRALRDRRAGAVGRGRRARRAARAAGRGVPSCGRWRSARSATRCRPACTSWRWPRMDASVLSLILYSYPALVTGAAILLGRESANRRRLVALVTASGGLVLVLAGAGVGSLDLAGCALGAGAALTYTTYILVSDGVTAKLDALPLAALVSTGAALSPRRSSRRRPARWTSASTPRAGSGSACAALVSTVARGRAVLLAA